MPARNETVEIEMLYRQHASALLLFATAIAGERNRAQDAIHQVFLKLLQNGNLHQVLDAKAFLFSCVRNAVLNEVKTRGRYVTLDSESVWFEPPQQDYAAELNLRRALHKLPDDQRQVIVLHVWAELTFSQIAEVLGINANTAASRYRYALSKLREVLCVEENSCANRG